MKRKTVEYKLVDEENDIVRSYEPRRKPKRSRILLHEWQSMMLEHSFRTNPYPDRIEKYNLFLKTGIPVKNIKIWFQNRRAREKSFYEEMEEIHECERMEYQGLDTRVASFGEEFQYYKY
ncbi:homeobox domain-containing protein [Encephalitozoon intestinalis ATCC 50506]|uniref:Homeobox domain-containing protein n=1 Tax=Encephalitozoon intestinalis (strain ATCC 50506) TaxID=876142 RepID=E0S6P8_ENCIT|nr:homeobox domain-containing protein [Encephalitozoon intestinalis ATCC 50506]ADM11383.1 homeobox domain-containing protein [Encephalitozoon intestinalis ATCC 50506]UTX45073.1 homeobox domain-containing protein [Encephalitozoon intestinalis]